MALSGTITGSSRTYGGVIAKLRIKWTATQSISGNYSKVTAKLYLIISQGGMAANGDGNIYIAGDGNSFSHGGSYKGSGTHLLKTATETINHSSDGSKSFTLRGTYSNDWWGSASSIPSTSQTLNKIPRNSKVSCPVAFKFGSKFTIKTNRQSSSFTHKITIEGGSLSKTITGVGASTSVSFSTAEQKRIANNPTATSRNLTINCECYSGSTYIGKSSTIIKANYVESLMKPTTIFDGAIETNNVVKELNLPDNHFIQNLSNITVYGRTLSDWGADHRSITLSSGTYSKLSINETITGITLPSTTKPTLKGTDSRWYSSSITLNSLTIIPYNIPLFSNVSLKRANGVEPIINLSLEAEISLIKVSEINNNSVQSLRWRYALKGSDSWSSWTNLTGYSLNNSTGQLILEERPIHSNLDPDSSYIIQIEIKDNYNTVVLQKNLNKATPTLSIKNGAVAINKQSDVERKGLDVKGSVWVNDVMLILERLIPITIWKGNVSSGNININNKYKINDFDKFIFTFANDNRIEVMNSLENSNINFTVTLSTTSTNDWLLTVHLQKVSDTRFTISKLRAVAHRFFSSGAFHEEVASSLKNIVKIEGYLKLTEDS